MIRLLMCVAFGLFAGLFTLVIFRLTADSRVTLYLPAYALGLVTPSVGKWIREHF